jgi:undecaprenyl diphosphate synthase
MVEFAKFITLGGKQKKLPLHVAIGTTSVKGWCEEKKRDLQEGISKHFKVLDEIIDYQIKNKIRVITLSLPDNSPEMLAASKEYFAKLYQDERIIKNQVRLFVIGQWYDLDIELSDIFKEMMDKTKMFDNFFLNLCVNYDGREELLGALRIINRKLSAGKVKEEELSENLIKENLYSSYFPPPELIVETSSSYSGLLLWDSKGAIFYFSERKWPLFDMNEFEEAISFYDQEATKDE